MLEDEEDFEPFLWAIIRRSKLDQRVSDLVVVDENDLFQKAWILLQKARKNFKDIDDYEFTVYIWSFIQTKLIDYIRREENTKDWERYRYREGMGSEDFDKDKVRAEYQFEGVELDSKSKKIIDLIGDGHTQEEIGDKLNVSQQAISKRIKNIKSEVVKSATNFVY